MRQDANGNDAIGGEKMKFDGLGQQFVMHEAYMVFSGIWYVTFLRTKTNA